MTMIATLFDGMIMNKILREIVYNKYNGHCAYCGIKIKYNQMQIDHIVPKERIYFYIMKNKGKSIDHIDNLNPACPSCNNYKNVWDISEFRRNLSKQVDRARKTSVNFRLAERFGMLQIITKKIEFYFEKYKSEKEKL